MSELTKIEWCDSTFNPWIGCTRVSPACDDCYAARSTPARSLDVVWGAGMPRHRTSAANWRQPLKWNAKRFMQCGECGWRGECAAELIGCDKCGSISSMNDARRRVFCASLADVFDNEVDETWRADLFQLIEATPNLDWLLLTKRIGNASVEAKWPSNVWLGITVINQDEADRDLPKLLMVPAAVRFISCEPLLGAIDLRSLKIGRHELDALTGAWSGYSEMLGTIEQSLGTLPTPLPEMLPPIDWVICGGESGAKARPMHPDWVKSIRRQCSQAFTPFLFKQHGEWLATEFCDDDLAMLPSRRTAYVARDGSFHDGSDGVDFFGGEEETAWVGKKAAGRILDCRTWDEFPKVTP